MQSKIIFLLLFMLSFTVMHDTVITLIDSDDDVLSSYYSSIEKQTCDVADVHELHGMFHFMALITPLSPDLDVLKTKQTHSAYLLQYTLPHVEKSTKPPIV